jgi:hypothetical protein
MTKLQNLVLVATRLRLGTGSIGVKLPKFVIGSPIAVPISPRDRRP